ncbi:hypothetical protein G3A_10495 [Bacillus sp. 17376]|nr:hypothetical protein G3A_10495 [Bacillus sp. 17376]
MNKAAGVKFIISKSFDFSYYLFRELYFISIADTYYDLLIGGLFVGIGEAIFSVGVTTLPKYYPKERHGFVNGIYGVGNLPRILRSEKHGEEFYKEMWKSVKEHGFWQGQIWNRKKNGTIYPEWLTISIVKNEAGEIKNFVGMFSEIPVNNK